MMKPLLLAIALLVASPAHAKLTDSKKIRDLMNVVMPKQTYELMLQGMIKQMLAAQPGAPPDAAEKMRTALREVIPYDEMVAITAKIYVKYFDDEDIEVLTKFYGSPTGKKTSKLLPEIMSETMKETVALVQQRLPAALEKQGLGPEKK